MNTALVHDWLTGMRGGEGCLEALCELYPHAPIYTLLHRRGSVSPAIERHAMRTSYVQHLPWAASHYRYYLPVFPHAIERFDLSSFDLIVSSSHCVAKGVRVNPERQCHVSYVHTPMRYLWDRYDEYFAPGRARWPVRAAMRAIRGWLQRWDVASSRGVTGFIANSRYIAEKILKYYGREAEVVYPPVAAHAMTPSSRDDGYYLVVSAFVPYKRIELAIVACRTAGRRLVIVGAGPMESALKSLAGSGVEFVGWQPREALAELYGRCRAVLFPGEEDFGIVPVEAMACGKPVIAYGRGGALESVVSAPNGDATGIFFYEATPASLAQAMTAFERRGAPFDPQRLHDHALQFDTEVFSHRMQGAITRIYQTHLSRDRHPVDLVR